MGQVQIHTVTRQDTIQIRKKQMFIGQGTSWKGDRFVINNKLD
jgi:hypothetical protein